MCVCVCAIVVVRWMWNSAQSDYATRDDHARCSSLRSRLNVFPPVSVVCVLCIVYVLCVVCC